jgi:ABC-type multidrug transport system ATPase subunit
MKEVIKVQHLWKKYGDLNAVKDLSFTVRSGDVYGFLGQNGAGKSTTIRMILDLIRPSSGTVEIFGQSVRKNRKNVFKDVGAIIERPDLYSYLTGSENLKLFARMSGVHLSEAKLMHFLELVGLAERGRSRVGTYSLGMKQRLGIAVALVHDPGVLILDEPTNGLDPQGIAEIRKLIQRLSKEEGKTILVSSHLLSEVEQIATRMLIIDKGVAMAEGSVQELLDPGDTGVLVHTTRDADTYDLLLKSPFADAVKEKNDRGIFLRMNAAKIPSLNRFLVQANVDVMSLESRQQLEHTFLKITSPGNYVDNLSA